MKHYLYILLFFLAACNNNEVTTTREEVATDAPEPPPPPFWDDIQKFKKQDSVSFPPANAILFIGSSSFTLWQDVADYFPGYTIINRGFGGSTLTDQIRYANDIVFPYKPKQIVIYCGENDLASSDSVTAETVYNRFYILYTNIKAKLPEVTIDFISLKPSPSRRHLFLKMEKANQKIKDFLSTQPNTVFIDVYSKMKNSSGQPMPEIFLEDSLHMNAKGYAIWQKEIKPHLVK
jgi:lysophospholipase L1-like esterase